MLPPQGQGGRRRLLWSCLVEPTSEKEAQSFLPSFLCGLAAGIVHGAKGVVVWVWTGRACVLLSEDGRVGVGWEGGRAEGWVCVLEEGRPRTGSPPRPWDLPPTGVALLHLLLP